MLAKPTVNHYTILRFGTTFGLCVLVGCGASLVSCYSHGETTCGQENSPRAPLRGKVTVREGMTTKPGAESLVFVELCGLYSDNPDPSRGHPNYRYSAMADADGNFQVDVPQGAVGLHTLKAGYTYGFTEVGDSASSGIVVVNAETVGKRPQPKVGGFVVSSTVAKPGDTLTFSLDAQAAAGDPISDEVLLAEPKSGFARAFEPPGRGKAGRGFPNGTWTVSIAAPAAGTYTYYAQLVSEQCAVSERLSVTVTVR